MYFGNLKSAKDDSQAPSMDSGTYLCDVGCDTCRSTTVCTICKPGFVLNTASSTCTLCPQMCATCGDNGCTQCMDGTYLSNGQCLRCQKPCVTCSSSATACISCPPGLSFFTGKCVKCSKNCITCSSATVCTVCTVGFSLATKEGETICRQCVSKCSSC